MGIDARMVLRITDPAHHLDPNDILPLSRELVRVIGAQHFFIKRGRPDMANLMHREPRDLDHALGIVSVLTQADLDRLLHDEVDPAWREHFRTRLTPGLNRQVYFQDGDPVIARDGEQLIEVHLSGRWYGRNYPRGNPIVYALVARHLEERIPSSEAWYGGDSSGVTLELFDADERTELIQHFVDLVESEESKAEFDCPACDRPPALDEDHNIELASNDDPAIAETHTGYLCHSCGMTFLETDRGAVLAHPYGHRRYDPNDTFGWQEIRPGSAHRAARHRRQRTQTS